MVSRIPLIKKRLHWGGPLSHYKRRHIIARDHRAFHALINLRVLTIKQTSTLKDKILLLVRFDLSNQPMHKYDTDPAVMDLWENLVKKGPFHNQNHRSSQPVQTNGKRPKCTKAEVPALQLPT